MDGEEHMSPKSHYLLSPLLSSLQRRRRREGFAENETNWQQQSVGTGEGS